MKKPTAQTLKKFSKDTAIFVGLFLIIYIAVNHIRQPSLPAHTPILTDITGNQVIISPNTPTLIYFLGDVVSYLCQHKPAGQSSIQ